MPRASPLCGAPPAPDVQRAAAESLEPGRHGAADRTQTENADAAPGHPTGQGVVTLCLPRAPADVPVGCPQLVLEHRFSLGLVLACRTFAHAKRATGKLAAV